MAAILGKSSGNRSVVSSFCINTSVLLGVAS